MQVQDNIVEPLFRAKIVLAVSQGNMAIESNLSPNIAQ